MLEEVLFPGFQSMISSTLMQSTRKRQTIVLNRTVPKKPKGHYVLEKNPNYQKTREAVLKR